MATARSGACVAAVLITFVEDFQVLGLELVA